MALTPDQRAAVHDSFRRFVQRRSRAASSLDVAELRPNPFLLELLIRGLGFQKAEQVAAFIVNQRFERGAVTSMGTTLQEICRLVAGPDSGSGTGGADLEIHRDSTRYFVQIKSGPVTVNRDIATQIASELNSARSRYGAGAVAILGICYGTTAELNPIAKAVLDDRGISVLVGTDFWDFLGDSTGVMGEVQEIARQTAREAAASLTSTIQQQIAVLTPIIREQQGLP